MKTTHHLLISGRSAAIASLTEELQRPEYERHILRDLRAFEPAIEATADELRVVYVSARAAHLEPAIRISEEYPMLSVRIVVKSQDSADSMQTTIRAGEQIADWVVSGSAPIVHELESLARCPIVGS